MKEVWIRVVGMPLHLWRQEILKKICDSCGGFVAIDKETDLRVKVAWARILVKLEGKARPMGGEVLSFRYGGKFRRKVQRYTHPRPEKSRCKKEGRKRV